MRFGVPGIDHHFGGIVIIFCNQVFSRVGMKGEQPVFGVYVVAGVKAACGQQGLRQSAGVQVEDIDSGQGIIADEDIVPGYRHRFGGAPGKGDNGMG